jgi:hypothetical protein
MQRGSNLALLKSDFYNDFWPRAILFLSADGRKFAQMTDEQ